MRLFEYSSRGWLDEQRQRLLSISQQHYPGDHASRAELVEHARRLTGGMYVRPPRLVEGKDGIEVMFGDGISTGTAVRFAVVGDASLLQLRPLLIDPAMMLPCGSIVEGDKPYVAASFGPLSEPSTARAIEEFRRTTNKLCDLLGVELHNEWNAGFLVGLADLWQERQGAQARARPAQAKARQVAADMGWRVTTG